MSSRKLILYSAGGLGMNLLNLIVSSYICSALLVGGFSEAALPFHTFAQTDLVLVSIWGVVILFAKIVDGVIDIPIGLFIDKIKRKNFDIRLALGISAILTIGSFGCLLIIPSMIKIVNTIYYGCMLCLFYISYTATMECYYSTFTDVTDDSKQIQLLSNYKSIFDVMYFIIGYVGVAALLTKCNIRIAALICMTLALSILFPIFLHPRGKREQVDNNNRSDKNSFSLIFKDKVFIYWLLVFAFINLGLQLFLGGINEYFSSTGLNMIIIMASVFIPLPLSFWLASKHYADRGFISTICFSLLYVVVGMLLLYIASISSSCGTYIGIGAGITISFGIGTLFSTSYSIPGKLAAKANNKYDCNVTASYFAIQGLIGAVTSGISGGILLVKLKQIEQISLIPIIVISTCAAALLCLVIGKRMHKLNKLGDLDE